MIPIHLRENERHMSLPIVESTVSIAGRAKRNFVKLKDPLTANLTITADNTDCDFGDELVIFLKAEQDGSASIDITLDQEKFLLTTCGDVDSTSNISLAPQERWMFNFFYDGEIWLDTFDNC